MFSLKEWLRNAVINGVRSGEFSPDYAALIVAEQVDKGRFTVSDAEIVYIAINPDYTATEAQQEEV